MFPTAVAAVLTAVFTVTATLGVLALARGARSGTAGVCGDTRGTELLHVVMSAAMIAMVWGWPGGPDSVGGAAQVVGFGVVTALLVVLALRPGQRARRVARLSHGLMAAAMVWMVAAMPLLMRGAPAPAGAPAAMGGHAGMAMAMGPAPAPAAGGGWAPTASLLLVAVLVAVGLAWAVRTVQLGSPAHRARAGLDAVRLPALVSGPCCHALMSVGTAGMLVAML